MDLALESMGRKVEVSEEDLKKIGDCWAFGKDYFEAKSFL